jgi:hypothetical protein
MPFEFPIRQTIVEEEKRGRILSLYSLVFLGTAPVGSLVAGTVATQLTASHVVRIDGLCCLVGVLVLARHLPALRALIRPLSANGDLLQDTTGRDRTAMAASLPAHQEPAPD